MSDDKPAEDDEQPPEKEREPAPDESKLLGATGVEEEVLAELARAEAELSNPEAGDDSDAEGSQV